MLLACKQCNSLFDENTKRSDCPHLEFPKLCDKHSRFNCGNPECDNNFINNQIERIGKVEK